MIRKNVKALFVLTFALGTLLALSLVWSIGASFKKVVLPWLALGALVMAVGAALEGVGELKAAYKKSGIPSPLRALAAGLTLVAYLAATAVCLWAAWSFISGALG